MKADNGSFDSRRIALLAAIGGVAFIIALVVGILAERSNAVTAGNNVFSDSAFGHKAFAQLLKEAGFSVLIGRHDLTDELGYNDLLIIIEPSLDYLDQLLFEPDSSERRAIKTDVLIVLPKWSGYVATHNDRWFRAKELVPIDELNRYLDKVGLDGKVVRSTPEDNPVEIWTSKITVTPTVIDLQLIQSKNLSLMVANEDSALFGRMLNSGHQFYVLSDPDILSNHGLKDDDNAIFIAQLASYFFGRQGGVIVIDALAQGFGRGPDLWPMLFELPFIIVTLQVVALTAVLLLIGWRRIGPVAPETAGMAAGSGRLIETMADLLTMPGRRRDLLQAYFEGARQDRKRGHAQPDDDSGQALEQAITWGRADASDQAAVGMAQAIHEWRGEQRVGRRNFRPRHR